MDISDKQKLIYNIYLKYSRRGKPYKWRKNFDNISNDTIYYLTKLEMFFNYFKDIKIEDYIQAPYYVIDTDSYYDLKFYLTQKARKCYTIFIKTKRIQPEITKENISQNLKFIINFCRKHNIKIKDYITFKSDEQNLFPDFVYHLKEHNIDMFILFGFDGFEHIIYNIPQEYINTIFNNFSEILDKNRVLFYTSNFKLLIKKCIQQLNDKI